ncbi:MAG: GNAT family N-acetyltransferase, partial [Nitrospiraceae bacterium]|nr:GNAT family N-acetyltransferase [Nitrospiraceae bacterium]
LIESSKPHYHRVTTEEYEVLKGGLQLCVEGVWTTYQAGSVVGMATVQTLISTAEGGRVGVVEDVIVAATHRRKGIGCLLLAEIETWSRRKGLKRLQLLADRENLSAIDFYSRCGWSKTSLICLRNML